MSPAACAGVGLRKEHFRRLLERPKTAVRWFEAVSENYMDSQGRPLLALESVRRDYPIALHGVSMSIGSVEGVDPRYLKNLKALIERIDPFIVSDHLCWSYARPKNMHDLLPLPFTQEACSLAAKNLEQVQSALGRAIALENVSSYLTYKSSEMPEWDFLTEVARRSGCKILLDVNNVYVSAKNHGFDPIAYLDAIDPELVVQMHLAGFTDMGEYLFDTHSRPVAPDVWKLFRHAVRRFAHAPYMVEWDEDIPDFAVLEAEAVKAAEIWTEENGRVAAAAG